MFVLERDRHQEGAFFTLIHDFIRVAEQCLTVNVTCRAMIHHDITFYEDLLLLYMLHGASQASFYSLFRSSHTRKIH